MPAPGAQFLTRPGLPGGFGALMDEFARAAEDFCRTLENLPPGALDWEQPSDDPDTKTLRTLCAHVIGAARRHTNYIRQARGLPVDETRPDPALLVTPSDVRARLADALRYAEGALDGLYHADGETVMAIRFQARWGPTYDPEMMLEHAIVHVLRHRRQMERWSR